MTEVSVIYHGARRVGVGDVTRRVAGGRRARAQLRAPDKSTVTAVARHACLATVSHDEQRYRQVQERSEL